VRKEIAMTLLSPAVCKGFACISLDFEYTFDFQGVLSVTNMEEK